MSHDKTYPVPEPGAAFTVASVEIPAGCDKVTAYWPDDWPVEDRMSTDGLKLTARARPFLLQPELRWVSGSFVDPADGATIGTWRIQKPYAGHLTFALLNGETEKGEPNAE